MRIAILSVHSHEDRSFLDDRILALVAGDLAAAGFDARLVAAFEVGDALALALRGFDVIVYERVWNRSVIERLRDALSGRTFVSCEGEHALADPPADFICSGDLRTSVVALLRYLDEPGRPLPKDSRAFDGDAWRVGLGRLDVEAPAFRPDLRPILVGADESWLAERSFSLEGSAGCPYRTDARDNPLYAGVEIPARYGRGCAFCTTGNHSEAAPPDATRKKVMEQLRYLRTHAPEIERLVLKDQNPFGWLTEVVEACVEEGLGGFSLLLETRADWWLKNERRFERALALATRADIRICPFLVGIENFSQAELDRYNKGTTVDVLERFLAAVDRWNEAHASLDMQHAAFGFVLLSPWTTLDDLRINLEAVERTRLDRWRGHLIVSRARLYPDTALYYLAKSQGLLVEEHDGAHADSSLRYGYFPAAPWRFIEPRVARFAELASVATARLGGRDELAVWRSLLELVSPGDDTAATPGVSLENKMAALVRPLAIDRPFGDGWRFEDITPARMAVLVRLAHPDEPPIELELVVRGASDAEAFMRSRHYDLRHRGRGLSQRQLGALRLVCDAIRNNDS